MSPPSAHSVLGLPYNASKEEVRRGAHGNRFASTVFGRAFTAVTISLTLHFVAQVKQAYRKLCLLHHPDLSAPDKRLEAERSFKLITEAYSQLHSGTTSRQSPGFSSRAGGCTHAHSLTSNNLHRPCQLGHASVLHFCVSATHRRRWCLHRGQSTAQHLQLGQAGPGAELQWARSPRLLPAPRAGRSPRSIVRPPCARSQISPRLSCNGCKCCGVADCVLCLQASALVL